MNEASNDKHDDEDGDEKHVITNRYNSKTDVWRKEDVVT